MLATLLVPLFLIAPSQERATATELVDLARTYLPTYEGEHRSFLTITQEPEVQTASHLLSAALTLEPENTYALWWKGHAQTLLGENQINRDRVDAGEAHFATALACFDQAIEIQPGYLWAWYARAMAHQRINAPERAIHDFRACILGSRRIIEGSDDAIAVKDAQFLNYKAKQWSADCHMQLFQFARAREEYRKLYADNSNNAWDLGIRIAETYLRQRDFESALRTYEDLLEVPEYADYHGAYTLLGYLEGLMQNPERAAQRLNEALQRERQPTLYPRLWLWILAPADQKAESLEQLGRFITHPPGDLSPWDLELGRFLMGDQTQEEFLNAAALEFTRRKVEAINLDDIMCEAWFYSGLRYEWNGQANKAIEAYKKALTSRPRTFKWEWAYARLHFAMLTRTPQVLPSGTPNNAPPGVHLFRGNGNPSDPGSVFDEVGIISLEGLRQHAPKGDLIQIISNGDKRGAPRLEVIGVP